MLAPSTVDTSPPTVAARPVLELGPAAELGAGLARSTCRLGGRDVGIALGGRRAGGAIAPRFIGALPDMLRPRSERKSGG